MFKTDRTEKAIENGKKVNIVAFWGHDKSRPYAWFSQWYKHDFVFDKREIPKVLLDELNSRLDECDNEFNLDFIYRRTFNCCEKFMMMGKAMLFDMTMAESIMKTYDPKHIKALGRKVKNFKADVWDNISLVWVAIGNYFKFKGHLKSKLLDTKNKFIVEASPYDKIWGIGIGPTTPMIDNPKTWRGTNKLGEALMIVRDLLV